MARCNECIHCGVCGKRCMLVRVDTHTWDEYRLLGNVEKYCADHIQIADVAPKAEVAIEVIEYLENNGLLNMTPQGIAALKKKYTERCPDCKHFAGCECFSGMTCDQYDDGSSETVQEQAADTDDVVLCKDCFYNKNGSCMMSEKLDKDNYDPNYSCGRGYRE